MHISSLIYTYHTNISHRQSLDVNINNFQFTEVNSSLKKMNTITTDYEDLNTLLSKKDSLNPRSVLYLMMVYRHLDINNILSNRTESKLKYISNVCYQDKLYIQPHLINETLVSQTYCFSKGLPLEVDLVQEYIKSKDLDADIEFKNYYRRLNVNKNNHNNYHIRIAKEYFYLSKNGKFDKNLAETYLKGIKNVRNTNE